jgi:hypothetical protein
MPAVCHTCRIRVPRQLDICDRNAMWSWELQHWWHVSLPAMLCCAWMGMSRWRDFRLRSCLWSWEVQHRRHDTMPSMFCCRCKLAQLHTPQLAQHWIA